MYVPQFHELPGLSRAEIDAIVPGTAALEVYDQLMTIVKEASRRNLSQAELKARVETLGDIASTIAKKSARLAKFFL